jgi:hypothetical protein
LLFARGFFQQKCLILVCYSSTFYTKTTVTPFVFYIFAYYISQHSSNAVQGFYCYCFSNAGIVGSNFTRDRNVCVCVCVCVKERDRQTDRAILCGTIQMETEIDFTLFSYSVSLTFFRMWNLYRSFDSS